MPYCGSTSPEAVCEAWERSQASSSGKGSQRADTVRVPVSASRSWRLSSISHPPGPLWQAMLSRSSSPSRQTVQ